jgi:hypothetical protein
MNKTSRQSGTRAKRMPQTSDKMALSAAQLDAARGGASGAPSLYNGCAPGKHYPGATL